MGMGRWDRIGSVKKNNNNNEKKKNTSSSFQQMVFFKSPRVFKITLKLIFKMIKLKNAPYPGIVRL